MLGIVGVARGRQAYYLATVPTGRGHDAGLVEAEGRWLGSACDQLGLAGAVDAARLGVLLSGADPSTGEVLSPRHARVRTAGFDCTFSAPKSVSLLHALGPQEAVTALRESHEAAVAATVGYLETNAVARRPHRTSIPCNALASAAFLHRTSRAPDPHLHTHVLVANCAPGADGQWSALDGRGLFAQASAASHLYDAQLRAEIVARLGLRFGPMRGSWADIIGLDPALLKAFSRRSTAIEERLAERGWSSPRAREVAALATRPPKDLATSYEELVEEWWRRAAALGIPSGHFLRLVESGRRRPQVGPGTPLAPGLDERHVAEILGPAGVTARSGTFSRADVVRSECRVSPAGLPAVEVERRAEAVLSSPEVVSLPPAVPTFRRRDGRSFPSGVLEQRFTTLEILALETEVAERARVGLGRGLAVADRSLVSSALAARAEMPADWNEPVRRLLLAGHAVDVVDLAGGPAGAGVPSDVLDAARDGWAAGEVRVLGTAPSLHAARRLEALTGIESVPLDLIGRDPAAIARAAGRGRPGVLVVGSAQAVDPRRLVALLAGAERAGAKVVLAADRPMQPLEHSGLARAAVEVASAPAPAPDERAGIAGGVPAPACGRCGDERAQIAGGVEWVDVCGTRVALARTAGGARDALVEAGERLQAEGRQVLLVAPDRATATLLASRSPAPVVLPGALPAALERRPAAVVLALGPAAVLPSAPRRRVGVVRAHAVVTAETGEAERRGLATEAALPPRLVREAGMPPRDHEGRQTWRQARIRGGHERERSRSRSIERGR